MCNDKRSSFNSKIHRFKLVKGKIRIHPLFLLFAIYLAFMGKLWVCLSYLFAIVTHEFAHAQAARLRGYRLKKVTVSAFGGVIEGGERYSGVDGAIIALSAPIFNIIVAICIVALWWLYPTCYAFTEYLCYANLTLALFNLIPAYPLDGGRLVVALSKNKLKSAKAMKITSTVLAVCLIALCIASIFFAFNLSFGIVGCFLLYTVIFNCDNTIYSHIVGDKPFDKNYRAGLKEVKYAVNQASTLYVLIGKIKKDELATFEVLDDEGRKIYDIPESILTELCIDYPLATRLELINLNKYNNFPTRVD